MSSSARRSSWIVLCGVLSMVCVVAAPGITRAAKYHYYMWALRNRAGFLEKALDEREDKAMLSSGRTSFTTSR